VPAIGRALGRLLGSQPTAQAPEPEPAAPTGDYHAWIRNDYSALVDQLGLTAFNRHVLRSRWLDQVLFAERSSGRAQRMHYSLRMIAIVGGVLIPALVGVSASASVGNTARTAAWFVGVMVAIAVAIDGFYHYGERWRHYRRLAERLKADGWLFFELAGPYSRYDTHEAAMHRFCVRVEALLAEDVGAYLTSVSRDGSAAAGQDDAGDKPA
jgi:hypothetical protein